MEITRDYENEVLVLYAGNDIYYDTDYKILCGYSSQGLLKLYKSLVNGRIRLSYDLQGMYSLGDMLTELTENELDLVCEGIGRSIKEVEENGFLRVANLLLKPEYVFFNGDNPNITKLVYLPCLADDSDSVANHLSSKYTSLLECMIEVRGKANLPTELLYKRLLVPSGGVLGKLDSSTVTVETHNSKTMCLISNDDGERVVLDSGLKVIGRTGSRADILIDDSSISREHCCIGKKNDEWFIEDMGSKNGTFVNGVRLKEDEQVFLKEGDAIQISKREYTFTNGGVW